MSQQPATSEPETPATAPTTMEAIAHALNRTMARIVELSTVVNGRLPQQHESTIRAANEDLQLIAHALGVPSRPPPGVGIPAKVV